MVTFDSAINTIIPWVVAIIGLYILYKPLKEPLAPLFNGIGSIINGIKTAVSGKEETPEEGIILNSLEYE